MNASASNRKSAVCWDLSALSDCFMKYSWLYSIDGRIQIMVSNEIELSISLHVGRLALFVFAIHRTKFA